MTEPRPTPETDTASIRMERLDGDIEVLVAADFARRLERERDEAREVLREIVRTDDLPGMCVPEWDAAIDRASALLDKDGS